MNGRLHTRGVIFGSQNYRTYQLHVSYREQVDGEIPDRYNLDENVTQQRYPGTSAAAIPCALPVAYPPMQSWGSCIHKASGRRVVGIVGKQLRGSGTALAGAQGRAQLPWQQPCLLGQERSWARRSASRPRARDPRFYLRSTQSD